jgi:hypothetical protein
MLGIKMDMKETSKIILSGEYSRRRGYLTNVITTINILAITGTISIWAFFLKWDMLLENTQSSHKVFAIQLAWAGGLSSILLGLWRIYARFLDSAIIKLYPAMYLCEREIIPKEISIFKPPGKEPFLANNFVLQNVIWKDVRNKDFGSRGHQFVDWIAVILIVLFSVISLFSAYNFGIISFALRGRLHLVGWLLIGNVVGLLLVAIGWLQWRNKEVKWPIPKNNSEDNNV